MAAFAPFAIGAALGGALWGLTGAWPWMFVTLAVPFLCAVMIVGTMGGWHKYFAVRRRWKWMTEVAGLIGARTGTFVSERRGGGGGLQGLPSVRVITIRSGARGDVLRAQIDAAVRAGYPRPPVVYENSCYFTAELDLGMLPYLTVQTVAPESERARHLGFAIPARSVAVIVLLECGVGRPL